MLVKHAKYSIIKTSANLGSQKKHFATEKVQTL